MCGKHENLKEKSTIKEETFLILQSYLSRSIIDKNKKKKLKENTSRTFQHPVS